MSDEHALTVKSEAAIQPSLMQRYSAQFYDWEKRGRGWLIWDQPVDIEPPFEPFFHYLPHRQLVDDARKPTFFSELADSFKAAFWGTPAKEETPVPASKQDISEVYLDEWFKYSEAVEFQLTLPEDFRVSRESMERFLLTLANCHSFIAFEIIGMADNIIVQVSCREVDQEQVFQQLHAYFPQVVVTQVPYFLNPKWEEYKDQETAQVDFGLSNEFVRPLTCYRSFEIDPLTGIIGALSNLQEEEIAIFQVLFAAVMFPWAESIYRSVTDWEGRPFFVDAPEMVALAKQKISSPLFATTIRAAARSPLKERAWQIVRDIGSGLNQFTNPMSNELIPLSDDRHSPYDFEFDLTERTSHRSGMILNLEELVSIVHFPSSSIRIEKLDRQTRHTKAAPLIAQNQKLILGENIHNGKSISVTLSSEQRSQHMHVIGASGTGKSTFLINLIVQNIEQGEGIGVLDPHGDLIDQIMERIPDERMDDVVIFDPSDQEYPIGFNILTAYSEIEKNLLASDLVSAFKRLSTSWGDQMTTVFDNAILAFLESEQGGTLADLRKFLVDPQFRSSFLQTVQDQEVIYYWENEFPLLSGKPQAPILTRLNNFLRPKILRYIVSQKQSQLDIGHIMNEGKIFLAKLSQGLIGEENAYLLGTILISKFQQLALSRQEIKESERRAFYLYIDEFHNFITPSMATILTGARKYRLGLVLAHQDLRQIESRDSSVASAVLSNPYTRVCFRVGDSDARKLSEGFSYFEARDLQNLSRGEAIIRMERAEYDFNLKTSLPPPVEENLAQRRRERIIQRTREKYASRREEIEKELDEQWEKKKTTPPPVAKEIIEQPPVEEKESIAETEPLPDLEIKPKPKPREKPKTQPAEPAPMGRGGQEHKYLQQLIKQWAEGMGYRTIIEKPILDGSGSVDVALEKGEKTIACEVSVTSTADQEIGNIEKCLQAGFDHIFIVSTEPKQLRKIREKIKDAILEEDQKKIECLLPENLFIRIEELEAESAGSEETIAGYKVKVNYKVVSEKEKEIKKQSIAQVVLQAIKRLRDKKK